MPSRNRSAEPSRPKTKWRPASLPASTVPRSVGPARRRDRLSQGGSGRGLAAPVGPSGSFAGSLLIRFRFLRVPSLALRPVFGSLAGSFLLGLAASNSSSLSVVREASFAVALSRFLPPGGFRFRRTLEGKWVRLWLAPLPRASSFRLPGPSLPSTSVLSNFRRSPLGRAWERLSVSGRPRPATGRTLAPESESRQALNRGFGLWITGITGIIWINWTSVRRGDALASRRRGRH